MLLFARVKQILLVLIFLTMKKMVLGSTKIPLNFESDLDLTSGDKI